MSKVSLRRLVSRLTAIALSATSVGVSQAGETDVTAAPGREADLERELDAELTIDRDHLDDDDAAAVLGQGLALAADRMRPLSAMHVVTTWALSADPLRRLAVAHALEWEFPVVGDAVAIEHLAHDPEPAIRAAAARAAWARRARGVDPRVIESLADDPDPIVRSIVASAR